MKIVSWNINGWNDRKKDAISTILTSVNADIILLIETHLKTGDNIDMHNYKTFLHCRTLRHINARRNFGGTAILVKETLFDDYEIYEIDKNVDGICIFKIKHILTSYLILLITVYLPPERSPWGRNAEEYLEHMSNVIRMYSDECDVVYMCGDLNARVGSKQDSIAEIDNIPQRKILDKTCNKHGDALIDFLIENKLCIVNGRFDEKDNNFTFISSRGKSVVDYFFVSIEHLNTCKKFEVLQSRELLNKYCDIRTVDLIGCIPDHSLLSLIVDVPSMCTNVINGLNDTDTVNSYQTINNADISHIPDVYFNRFKVTEVPTNFMSSENIDIQLLHLSVNINHCGHNRNDLDKLYREFCDIYHDEMSKWFKKKRVFPLGKKKLKKCCKPFWCDELQILWHDLRAKEKLFLAADVSNRNMLRLDFKNSQNTFDRTYRKYERKFQNDKLMKIETVCVNNPGEFWKMLKQLGPKKKQEIPFEVYDENGFVTSNCDKVMNKWYCEYKKLFSIDNENSHFNDNFFKNIIDGLIQFRSEAENLDILSQKITENEIRKCVKHAKNNKAVGIDCIPYEVLKNDLSITLLTTLFDKIFQLGIIPSTWKLGIIKPIPKPSLTDAREPLQYRGITLLSTIYKLFTSILNTRLMAVAENEGIYKDEQNGFRSRRSCIEHIFSLTSIIRNRKNMKLSTFICFIDFEKAFDKVNHFLLFHKLLKYKISGKFYDILRNIYSDAEAGVCINGLISQWFNVEQGVRQGDSLSATLFCLYINDIVDTLNECIGIRVNDVKITCLLYADDIVLISENEKDLQNMLKKLETWCYNWRMRVNIAKSKVMHCRPKNYEQSNFTFKYGNENLDYVDRYKYLGVVLDYSLNFDITTQMLANSANRALGSVFAKYKENKGLGYNTYTKLYNTGVVPILDYGAGVWGYNCHKRAEIIQNRAIRFYLGVHRFASNLAVNGDIGWVTCDVRHKIEMLRLWNRLLSSNDDRLVKKIFKWDRILCKNNWCKEIKLICNEIETDHNFENNIHIDLHAAKNKLFESMCNKWRDDVLLVPKLRFYNIFKSNFATEKFVTKIKDRKKRSVLSQFRYSVLPLSIETGRFQDIPIEYRFCLFCNDNVIESESHFLLYCSCYNDFRFELYEKVRNICFEFDLLEEERKIQMLMDENIIIFTTEFLVRAFDKRQNILYQ